MSFDWKFAQIKLTKEGSIPATIEALARSSLCVVDASRLGSPVITQAKDLGPADIHFDDSEQTQSWLDYASGMLGYGTVALVSYVGGMNISQATEWIILNASCPVAENLKAELDCARQTGPELPPVPSRKFS